MPELVPASDLSLEQLTQIYNAGRTDYIVPMQMDAAHFGEYLRIYDVDLEASFVVRDGKRYIGIGMLGLRDDRAWITRVGIAPEARGQHFGDLIVGALIDAAVERNLGLMQLEVIEGNAPAIHLFHKLGFVDQRRLLVTRRKAGELAAPDALVQHLTSGEIDACLREREGQQSWVDETASMRNAGNLEGLRVGDSWVVFRNTGTQITHLAFGTADQTTAANLVRALYSTYPTHDTYFENLFADSSLWPTLQALGFYEDFTRIEMIKALK